MEVWERRFNDCAWVDEQSKRLFLKFAADAVVRQIGAVRIDKYRADVSLAHNLTGKTLLQMLHDIEATVSAVNSSKRLAPATKRDCKRTLGSIYNFWKTGDRSLTYLDRKLKPLFRHRIGPKETRLPKEVLTRVEVRELAEYGNNFDKAIIYLLFESGMRSGEFTQLRKNDVQATAEGMLVHVPCGKTGERRIVVVEAASFVGCWLNEHPLKVPDAVMWTSPTKWKPLGAAGLSKRIRICLRAMNQDRVKKGIPQLKKPVNLHNFRHSRATELGAQPGMTEAIMCKFFGWTIGSDMPRVYLHLTDEQVKTAVLRTYGKTRPEDTKVVTHRTCPRCKEENPIALNYCGRCGSNMDSGKVVSSIEEMKAKVEDLEAQVNALASVTRSGARSYLEKKFSTGKHPPAKV